MESLGIVAVLAFGVIAFLVFVMFVIMFSRKDVPDRDEVSISFIGCGSRGVSAALEAYKSDKS